MSTLLSTSHAPKEIGHYSKSFKSGNLIFCSGQIGLNPETMKIVEGGIEEETKQVCRNLEGVLAEHHIGLKNVVKTTIFLKNINDFKKVNEIYKDYFLFKPARSTIEVNNLPAGALLEIEAIAEIN